MQNPFIAIQALELSVACLSFDFVGTSVEDWAEDVATLQIPAQWRSCLEDLSTLHLYTDYYFASTPPLSNAALECLVRCASVRRSLFSSEETRLSFLSTLVNITLRVLQVGFHPQCSFR
jgi:exportin-7